MFRVLQLGVTEVSTGPLFLRRKVHSLIYDKILLIFPQNNIGMTEALVDDSGYPRQDVDVYQVRDARHKIICNWQPFILVLSVSLFLKQALSLFFFSFWK